MQNEARAKNAREPRKRQRTLFTGPGAVQQKLIDKNNRVHLVPIDESSISNHNEGILQNECIQCGKTFATKQGLGGHMKE